MGRMCRGTALRVSTHCAGMFELTVIDRVRGVVLQHDQRGEDGRGDAPHVAHDEHGADHGRDIGVVLHL